jgi:FkbM family methyltransferase
MKKQLKKIIELPFNILGFDLIKRNSRLVNYRSPTSIERLKLAKKLGFTADVIFDGGAHLGNWSKEASHIYQQAKFVLFEPNTHITKDTKATLEKTNIDFELFENAIGAKDNEKVTLNIWGENTTGASVLGHVQGNPSSQIQINTITLDTAADTLKVKPNLVKLDLQGGEFNALLGAEKILQNAEMFIVEFGCLEAYVERTTPRQLLDIMYDNNYCLYDIVDVRYRPYDNALTGGDFFFVKNDSILRSYKGYV